MQILAMVYMLAALPATVLPSGDLDQSLWDRLLKRYVNGQSRVDYRSWKEAGLEELDSYLQELARPWPTGMPENAEKAALINAYNALTVRWILSNYPVRSIWRSDNPFRSPRHTLSGNKVSLDDIESRLRRMGDPRIHAALVCAARSCPPLRREAYISARIDQQLDDNVRAWLGNPDLNEFFPERRVARVSMIFKWYAKDFAKDGGSVQKFLARYAPPAAGFLRTPDAKIQYKSYAWGLNDSRSLGSDYSHVQFLWDRLRNSF